jgi:hypothetical protein
MELITLPSGGMIVKIPALMTAQLSRKPFGYGILFSFLQIILLYLKNKNIT